jgi:N-acetylmuramoyl-L-alanine amidase
LPPSKPGIRRIVLDPGHGGRDPGAIGPSGLREKDVVLKITKRLRKQLKKRGYEVFLTRQSDIYLPLEERTAIANTKRADLFVSIHANASRKRGARGIETYILNFPSDEEAMELAARENAISTKKLSDLQIILYDLMLNAKVNESGRLAHHVQDSMRNHLNHGKSSRRDRGIKQAPFYVLMDLSATGRRREGSRAEDIWTRLPPPSQRASMGTLRRREQPRGLLRLRGIPH